MTGGTTFDNHRGVVPLLWVFFALAICELLAVHLFVALKWPWIGWPLTILSLLSIVWLIGWIRSWARLPHRLEENLVVLNMGSLRQMNVPLNLIERVRATPPLQELKAMKARNLVPIAHPNRIIELCEPVGGRRVIAIRLDDPVAFDAAMRSQGIEA